MLNTTVACVGIISLSTIICVCVLSLALIEVERIRNRGKKK